MKQTMLFTLLLAGSLITTTAFGATYKWVDEKGNVHYTQHPPADSSYERMKVEKTPRTSGTPTPPAATPNSATNPAPSTKNNAVVKEEMAKNAEIRAQNCESAKKNLEILTVYTRFRDKDGNVTRMDDQERLQKIEEAKQQITEFCE